MNARVVADVSNAGDMVTKLLGYANEELVASRETDDRILRSRHLERAQVFLSEALRVYSRVK
jgi:hypothetical protein